MYQFCRKAISPCSVISEQYKTIFVHQRKSGGTSIKRLFPDNVGDLNNGLIDPRWRFDLRVGHYFSFTIVRNPWDKSISAYNYIGALRRRSISDVLANMPNSNPVQDLLTGSLRSRYHYSRSHAAVYYFRVKALLRGSKSWSGSRRFHRYNNMHAACPQSDLIFDSGGQLAVDAFHFLEDMDAALTDLTRRSGIPTNHYQIRNAGVSRHDYRELLSPDDRSAFAEIFQRDNDLFGSSFDAGPGVSPGPPVLLRNGGEDHR